MNNKKYVSKKIGALFCGGCNPIYNRELLYRELKHHYEPLNIFEIYKEEEEYDLLIIINGCASECVINQNYQSPIVCLNSSDAKIATQKIDNMLL